MNKHSLLRFYRQLLFHENGNAKLNNSIRVTMKQIRMHGLDDIENLLSLMRKQCKLVKEHRYRAKFLRQIRALQTMGVSSSSSSMSDDENESKDESTTSEDDDEEDASRARFRVERIRGFRLRGETNTRMYLVRWKGYDSDEDTWEPVDRLMEDQCGDLVARFHREHMRFF